MKKTLVKTTAVLLSLIMLFSAFASVASAEGNNTYGNLYFSTDGNEVTILGGINLSGKIEIPSSINGNPVVAIADEAFEGREDITEIVLPSGIEMIGNNAFKNCIRMEKINLPDTLRIIGEYAFAWCFKLKKINIPSSVEDIRDRAFWDCEELSAISFDTKNLKHLGGFVFGATAYSEDENNIENGVVYIENQIVDTDPAKVRGSIAVRDGSVILPDYSFYYCTAVTEVVIPDSVCYIGSSSFAGCNRLVKLTVGKNANNVYGISGVTRIFVDKDNPYYTNDKYGNLYSKDKSTLCHFASGGYDSTSFTVASTVKTIAPGAFMCCDSLEYVTIGDSVEEIGFAAFEFCSNLKRVILGRNIKTVDNQAFHISYEANPEVYYSGTQEEWECISWGSFNEKINNENVNLNFDINSIGKNTKISVDSFDGKTSVDYNKTATIIADVSDMPDGAYIKWSVNGDALELSDENSGYCGYVKAVNGGTATVKAQVYTQNDEPVENACAEITITVNDGIFQRITAFFENIISQILALFNF